jgi:hypothetical protein
LFSAGRFYEHRTLDIKNYVRSNPMSQWRESMADADAAKRAMVRDRAAGEREFDRLLAAHPRDGMIYFKRGEAFEELGEAERAAADYRRAEELFPMEDWKTRARQRASRLQA